MAFGLCGAQRVGKSTLAEAFAKEQGILFLRTDTSGVFKVIGLDPKVDYDLLTQLAIQRVILEALIRQYEEATKLSRIFITDRTPIDSAAYMLAAVSRQNCTDPALSREVQKYVQDCIDAANRFFSLIVLVQPGIVVVEAEGKAPGIPAYQEHINCLVFGLLLDERMLRRHSFIRRGTLNLGERNRCLASAAQRSLDAFRSEMGALTTWAH